MRIAAGLFAVALAAASGADLPRPAPPIKAVLEGQALDLTKYKGKVLIIEFLNPT